MKTLVIHPQDETTDFLKLIYQGKDWTVISDPKVPKTKLREAIKSHDRIIMMGHGTPKGMGGNDRYLIDSSWVWLLRTKKELVGIWCDADQFFCKYDLKGIYTGMIISETSEAWDLNVEYESKEEIDYSNNLFAHAWAKHIDGESVVKNIQETYQGEGNIIAYNRYRIYEQREH